MRCYRRFSKSSFAEKLPAARAAFHPGRGAASLPDTLSMIGFAFGGVLTGRLADRAGVRRPRLVRVLALRHCHPIFRPHR